MSLCVLLFAYSQEKDGDPSDVPHYNIDLFVFTDIVPRFLVVCSFLMLIGSPNEKSGGSHRGLSKGLVGNFKGGGGQLHSSRINSSSTLEASGRSSKLGDPLVGPLHSNSSDNGLGLGYGDMNSDYYQSRTSSAYEAWEDVAEKDMRNNSRETTSIFGTADKDSIKSVYDAQEEDL